MASGIYNKTKYDALKKVMDVTTDTLKVMLLTTGYTFNPDHYQVSDVNTYELAATGNYSTGGATLGSVTLTQDDTNDWAVMDATDTVWSTATFTAYFAIIYDSTTGHLIGCVDFGGAKSVSSGTFTIQWNAAGIVKLA